MITYLLKLGACFIGSSLIAYALQQSDDPVLVESVLLFLTSIVLIDLVLMQFVWRRIK